MRINRFAQEHNTIRMTLAEPRPRPFDTGTKELTSGPLCLQYILSPLVVERDSILTSALDDYKKERLRTKIVTEHLSRTEQFYFYFNIMLLPR